MFDDENDSSSTNILTLNAIEHLRRFLNDEKTFFDSDFLKSVTDVIFCKSVGNSEEFRDLIRTNIITFGTICIKYNKLKEKYQLQDDFDVVDSGLIETAITISQKMVSDDLKYSSQFLVETFRTVMNNPSRRILLETQESLKIKFHDYIKLHECKIEDTESLQTFLDSKLETMDIVDQIESFTQFVSKGASDCNSLQEYTKSFIDTIDGISASLTTSVESNKEIVNLSEVLSGKGYSSLMPNSSKKVKCGISVLDSLMGSGGFDRGRIYTFGGQTGGGKSTVLLNILFGMLKQINGIYFSEYDIFDKALNNTKSMEIVKNFISSHIEKHKNDRKKLLLFYTLENTKEETVKRLMCRMGLIPTTYWIMIERDAELNKLFNEKGYNFTFEDLPSKMDYELRVRIYNFAQYANLLCSPDQLGSIEIIWHTPQSISSYDILLDCKRYQRKGFDVEAIMVDYPDKMRSNDASKNLGDQNWLELGKIVDNLKALAAQINVPVIIPTQLTKEGNKSTTTSKLGQSAGSTQKEYNTDTQINMNFNTTDGNDNSISEYFKEFTNQQRRVNLQKKSIFNNMITIGSNSGNIASSYDLIMKNTERAADIIHMRIGIPTIQRIDAYITKNRDSIAKTDFDMYIAYGMYLVSDFDQDVYLSSKYAVESYMLIANYMIENDLISPEAYSAAVENEKRFISTFNTVYQANSGGGINMKTKSKQPSDFNKSDLKIEKSASERLNELKNMSTDIPQIPFNSNDENRNNVEFKENDEEWE